MSKIAVFPGSFDPITKGHLDILQRAVPLFDEVIVAIGINSQKKYLFSLEQRLAFIEATFEDEPKVKTATYEGLTVEFCKNIGAKYLVRGLRSNLDFEYEKPIAQLNNDLYPDMETIFLISQPQYGHISSTIIREIYKNDGDISQFLPKAAWNLMKKN
ncbi:MAG: pantetheine-phosphate adenylyltransferase [Chitinophagales bacterium]